MPCPYMHHLCRKCDQPVCRAYFPEKQPYIKNDTLPICMGENYEKECLIYPEAVKWREERRRKSLKEHCPFAANTVCGKPWIWICKGATPPFLLTEALEGERGSIIRDDEGNVLFKEGRGIEDIKETCLSGDPAIYEGCPNYVAGVKFREYVKKIKGKT